MKKRNSTKVLIATHNPAKITELSQLLSDLPLDLVTLADLKITDEVDEDGQTYLENSQKKALYYAQKTRLPAIGDDGGVEIAALNYEPGVHSRRWLGESITDEEIIAHMRKLTKKLPDDNRVAFYRTVISFAVPEGFIWSVKGSTEGIITKTPSSKRVPGYPYRAFFFFPDIKKYYFENELSEEERKTHNHRHKALAKLKPLLIEKLTLIV